MPGSWRDPTSEYIQVGPYAVPNNFSYGIPANWSVDAAQPSLTPINTDPGVSSLNWSSTSPIGPMARLSDGSALTALQDWLIVAGVGMGIGGAMLASLAFERLGPRQAVAVATGIQKSSGLLDADPARSRDRNVARPRRLRQRTAVIIVAIAIGLHRQRQTRRRH